MPEAFTMKEMMEQFQVSEDALRYYEKIDLLPPVARKNNGHRIYNQSHKEALLMIHCLKKTGMSLQELKPIIKLQLDENTSTNSEWRERLGAYQKKIELQQQALQQITDMIKMKLQTGQKFGEHSPVQPQIQSIFKP
ncbi:DNA-binding transcriptional regulator, MerR family [Paenibacillus algorifonticola]|uniref:DNA-binding transcriptional regulator, MerR family n=1 Tax=Paenibacillus algorifonticola TaxID=684063 RepID=A0A1I2IEN0_9BACL|nr:MerR family transcriptional regulator [Paenibacillus algorifonticola]SFF39547.1 DNA-binding transcriptional regulator, MerR family [Paenibacillus algorifonticola]